MTMKKQHEILKSTETAMCLRLEYLGALSKKKKNVSVLEQNYTP